MITIISKIELDSNGYLKYTDVGYTESSDVTNSINEEYDITLGKFIGENRTKLEIGVVDIHSFFDSTSFVYEARTQVDDIGDLSLLEINDISEL